MEINEGQTTAHMLAREGCHTCREICHQRYRKENQDKQARKQANKLAFICQSRTRGPGRPGKLKEEGNEVLKPETIARHPGEMPLDRSLGF